MKKNDKKKKLLIELAVVGALLVVFAVVVLVDTFSSRSTVLLTEEQAQEVLNETIVHIPLPSEYDATMNALVNQVEIKVQSVEKGIDREQILHCEYKTKDLLSIYNANKTDWFQEAYAFAVQEKDAGNMVNSGKIRRAMDGRIAEDLQGGEQLSGNIDIYVYDIKDVVDKEDPFIIPYEGTNFRVYLSDDLINTIFGGLLTVNSEITQTNTIQYDGKTVDISRQNTLRNGLSSCFKLQNYSAEKPDTSPFFLNLWNDLCGEFYRNFIKDARWTHLAGGLLTTLEITLLAAVCGIILGFICAIIRCTHDKTGKLMIPDQIVRLYLAVIRGTPVMVQLLIIYFVLLLPVGIEKFPAAVICFTINSGAYVAEIVRGGIMSVDNGQIEAGRSLGLNYIQTMYYIVVPQAFKAVLPSLANEFITLLKESSVAFYIGVADLTQGGLKIRSITYSNFMPLLAVAVIYLVIVLILTKLVKILERRLRKDER